MHPTPRADRTRSRRPAPADLHLLPPALAPEARVALTLRLLGGLTVAEIAAAFLVPETTGAADHPREAQDRGRRDPLPGARSWPTCPPGSAACSPFSTWCSTRATSRSSGEAPVRRDLTAEALRLTRVLRSLLPGPARGDPGCSR